MILDGVQAVRARIADACRRCGRSPERVRLIGVVKGRTVAQVAALLAAGVHDVGGNYLQEAQAQRAAVGAAPSVRWHGIGHLQRNKARAAVALFDVIHSVDSEPLAIALDRHVNTPHPLDVLVQVNVSGEATKSGVSPAEVLALVGAVRRLPHLRLLGFMTMAPLADDPEEARPHFRQLRQLRDAIDPTLTELSMGMSDDFAVAIEEGATMVRIGRALFAEQNARDQ